jgi:hypothetical protein
MRTWSIGRALAVLGTSSWLAAQNVGIGTSTPQARLHIQGAEPQLRIQGTGARTVVEFWRDGLPTFDWNMGTDDNAVGRPILWFDDGMSYRMVLEKGTGNVGIGTSTPTERLHVEGNLRLEGAFMPGNDAGTAGQVLVSQGAGTAPTWAFAWSTTVPPGVIVMYSGPWHFDATGLGTGPLTGWALCNGNNGTPNLLDRFVMGTISSADLNTTGGTNSYTLTVAQLPPHTHGVRAIFHGQDNEGDDNCGTGYAEQRVFYGDDNIWPSCADPARVTYPTDPTGSGAPIDNRPAFIRLAFIMKL